MATRTLEQTIKELESDIEYSPYEDLDCDILDYLKEYSSKKDGLEEELQKVTLEACKTVKLARILTELIEEKSSIENLPSAEPERKKSKLKTVGFLTCQCSECGAQFHELEYTNFCPNCGADMRGE